MRIRVFSAPACPWCNRVKEFLRGNNIEFEDIDASQNREAAIEMIKKSGQTGVPVVEIDGKIVIGFNEPELRKTLNIKS